MNRNETPARLSQPELQALLDATVDAVIVIDAKGHIESFNRSGERLFGYSAGELLGRNVSVLMTDTDRNAHDEYMARYLSTGVPHIIGIGREVDARRKDGSRFPVFLSVGQVHGIDESTRHLLQQVDVALARLERGEYSCCSRCGQDIETERLQAIPEADQCACCARRHSA